MISLKCNNAFENECEKIDVQHCKVCHTIGVDMEWSCKEQKCKSCKNKTENYYMKNKELPVWFDKGTCQFHVPDELKILSDAEKMLIQRLSPFVPLHHIKNVVFLKTSANL